MRTRDTPQRRVRLWLHDVWCLSGCTGPTREDHAQRTQTTDATLIVAAATDGEDPTALARAVHLSYCTAARRGTCDREAAHLDALTTQGIVAHARATIGGTPT